MNDTFYMVFVDGERSPAYKHETLEQAESEAKRLAIALNKKAYVLCTLKSFQINKFIIGDCRPYDDLPF